MPRGVPNLPLKMTKQRIARGWTAALVKKYGDRFPEDSVRAALEIDAHLRRKQESDPTAGAGAAQGRSQAQPHIRFESAGPRGPWTITIVVRTFEEVTQVHDLIAKGLMSSSV